MTVPLSHVNAADTKEIVGNDTTAVTAPVHTTSGTEKIITTTPEKPGKKVIAIVIANNAEQFGDDYLPWAQLIFFNLLPGDKYDYVAPEKVKKAVKEHRISVGNPKKAELIELGKDLKADYMLYARLEKVKFGQGLGSLPIGTQIKVEANVGIKTNFLETATEKDLVNKTFNTCETYKANRARHYSLYRRAYRLES